MFRLPKAIFIQEKSQKQEMVRDSRENFRELFFHEQNCPKLCKIQVLFHFWSFEDHCNKSSITAVHTPFQTYIQR